MAMIISAEECWYMRQCHLCPYPKCPDDLNCLKCQTHCPCCTGPYDGFCDKCSEEECANRKKPYEQNAIS